MIRTLLFSFAALVPGLVACGGPEVRHPYQADDKTPVNSTSESRLAGEDPSRPKAQVTSVNDAEDPTQPVVNSVADMPKGEEPAPAGKDSAKKPGKGGKPEAAESQAKPSKSGPKITKAECDKAFEKALELEIASRPEFKGIDKQQLVSMAKQMGSQQHGEAPCDATRAQYNCAMAATSTTAWKRCME